MSVAFIPLSTAIADGCPPGASNEEYIGMLQNCIRKLAYERAELCMAHRREVNALKQEIVDLDFSYSGKLASATKELEELKAVPRPMQLDGCLAIRALGVAAEHSYVHHHVSVLSAKLEATQKRNDELEKSVLEVNAYRTWELINEFLVSQNHPLLLDQEALENRFNHLCTLGEWLWTVLRGAHVDEVGINIEDDLAVMPNPNYVLSSDESGESADEL
jgi:hypothetical protein